MPAPTPPNVAAETSVGRVLGDRYRLLTPIGAGASAQVFLSEDIELRRRVAVKLLHPGLVHDDRFRRRFRAEARAAANLSHPHLVAVYDWSDRNEEAYLVTELLAGGSLRAMLDNGDRLSPSQALVIGLHAAQGLAYAHDRGLVHRDVKPANLLFGADGRLRIADFGIARAVAEAAWTEPDGALIGTARYAAPEQALGATVDGRADVYALALTVIEAVTGVVPLVESTALATMLVRQEQDVPVSDELGPLAPILAGAGRADPAERPTAGELADALSRAARELARPQKLPLAGLHRQSIGPDTEADGPIVHEDDTGVLVLGSEPMIELGSESATSAPAGAMTTRPRAAPPSTDHETEPSAPAGRRPPRLWPLLLLVAVPLLAAAAYFGFQAAQEAVTTPTHPVGTYVGRAVGEAEADIALSNWTAILVDGRADGTEVGEIIEQTPAPGVEWEEGQSVTLVVSVGQELRTVPTLVGRHVSEARLELARAGLGVGTVESDVYDEATPRGHVLEASAAPGDELETGTEIDLVLSAGPEPRIVPSSTGRPVAEVEAELTATGLIPIRSEEHSETVAEGAVIRTEPPAGDVVDRDSEIAVVVSLGPPFVVVPDVTGRNAADAADVLEGAGFVVVDTDGPPNADVLATDPPAGESHRKGTQIVIFTRR